MTAEGLMTHEVQMTINDAKQMTINDGPQGQMTTNNAQSANDHECFQSPVQQTGIIEVC